MHSWPRWLWLGIAAAFGAAAIFAFDLTPWVRGGFGWRWEYDPVPLPILGFVLLLVLYVWQSWLLLTRHARPRAILALAFLASAAIPLVAVGLRHGDPVYTLAARVFSEVASAHQWGAAQIDWAGGEWRQWTSVMARVGSHVGTSPPGLLLAYGFAADIADRTGLAVPLARPLIAGLCADYRIYEMTAAETAAGWLGVLSPVWAALTVFPLFSLARRVGARADAAVLLWPLVPGLAAFAGSNSTLFPLFAAAMMLPLAGGLTFRRAAAAGLVFGLATFFNFALLPLAGLAGFFVLSRWWLTSPRPPLLRPIMLGAAFALAGLLIWAVWFALTGETPLDLLRQSFGAHLELERPYAFWVWFHLWDWAVWSGLALTVAAIFAGVWRWRRRHLQPDAAALSAALLLTLLTLTLSGITRGESGRIWLFFSPLLLVILARADFDWRRCWRPLAVAQVALTAALVYAVDAYNAPDVPLRPALEHAAAPPTRLASFRSADGGRFDLIAAGIDAAGDLRLTVNGSTPTLAPVWFGLIAVDEASETAAAPQQPLRDGERMPSTCWAGGTQTDVVLSLPPLDASGPFYISLSAYGYRAGDPPLTVDSADGSAGTQVGLGPFHIASD